MDIGIHGDMKADVGVMCLQTRDCQLPPGAGGRPGAESLELGPSPQPPECLRLVLGAESASGEQHPTVWSVFM